MNVLNSTGPRIEPWGTPRVSSYQPDAAPLTTTLWALPFSQFFTQCTAYLLISQLDNLSRRMLWGTVSKALLKSRINYIHRLPFIHWAG